MNNSLKKVLALAMALVCLMSFAACGKNDTTTAPGQDNPTDNTTQTPTGNDSTTAPDDGTTDPSEPSSTNETLKLVYTDVTLNPNNQTVTLYNGTLDPSEITWSSEDPTIASVVAGVVTALKDGKTTVTATLGEQKVTCIVRVSGIDAQDKAQYALWTGWSFRGDVTLKLGDDDTFNLSLRDKTSKEPVKNLQWHQSPEFSKCCTMEVTEDGVKITATGITTNLANGGFVKVWTEYEGVTYECIIRVNVSTQTENKG